MKTKRIVIKLNSQDKIEALLQEIYDEACRQIISAQDNISKITESTPLTNETIENKAKYGKIINDFLTQKNNALAKKMDVSKLMIDVLKSKGDVEGAIKNSESEKNWDDILSQIREDESNNNKDEDESESYRLKK